MNGSKTPSAMRPKVAPLTAEQRYEGEKNLAHLLIIAHDEGVPAAMDEWRRVGAAMRTKAPNSPVNLPPAKQPPR
jgi:hypothetical protein